jgi:hypothetical protein
VREGLGLKMFGHSLPTFGGIHGVLARGQGLRSARALQGRGLRALKDRFDGSSEPGPEFDLAGDGMSGGRIFRAKKRVLERGRGRLRLVFGHSEQYGQLRVSYSSERSNCSGASADLHTSIDLATER